MGAACVVFGCGAVPQRSQAEAWTSPSADRFWRPPRDLLPAPEPSPEQSPLPRDLGRSVQDWRMADLIDVALRNHPETRAAWYAARAAAAEWLGAQGARYPRIDASATYLHAEGKALGARTSSSLTSVGPGAELNWLLFDFGVREASIEERRQALVAADFAHNRVLQNVIFRVQEAFLQYVNAKALLRSAETTLAEARTSLEAAQERHRAGMATIADVLQAKTAVSQAQLNLEQARGGIHTLRGVLATAMGIPLNTAYDVGDTPLPAPPDTVVEQVEDYIAKARLLRPDLAAQGARVEQALNRLKAVRMALYPSIVASGSVGQYHDSVSNRWDDHSQATLLFKVPLFDGYARQYHIAKAEVDVDAQRAALEQLRQYVTLQVWTSYYLLKTSTQRVRAADDLLASAKQSYEVALGRYRAGVGGMLDLMAARSSLEQARTQQAQARTDWYTSLAQLAWSAGYLWEDEARLRQLPIGLRRERKP